MSAKSQPGQVAVATLKMRFGVYPSRIVATANSGIDAIEKYSPMINEID